jgi:hypothetical protein
MRSTTSFSLIGLRASSQAFEAIMTETQLFLDQLTEADLAAILNQVATHPDRDYCDEDAYDDLISPAAAPILSYLDGKVYRMARGLLLKWRMDRAIAGDF